MFQELLLTYDDNYHQLLRRNKYAFGVLYQRSGQASEQDIFGNVGHCEKFEEFIGLLGEYLHHSEDDSLGFYVREWEQVMLKFYVLTRLPHSKTDSQQCARKARIGNCVVCVVFQSEEATFSPEIITSQFLHVYIVIQPVQSGRLLLLHISHLHDLYLQTNTKSVLLPKLEYLNSAPIWILSSHSTRRM